MKTLLITIISIFSFASLTQAQTATVDEARSDSRTSDVSAIRKVIIDQSDAFFAKNREKWASYWVHEPYISWTAQGGADRILTVSGWAAYSDMFEGYFSDPKPGPVKKILHENFQVTVLDKVATATYLQTRQQADRNLKNREMRMLEKQGNDWKLVSVYSRNIE